MRELGRLTAAKVAALKEPGRYPDGNGLYLQISPSQTKSWFLRFQLVGRCREMGLGGFADVGLMEARKAAQKARRFLLEGIDPIDERAARKRALKEAAAKRITFKDAAERYIEGRKSSWDNPKSADQWTASLQTYAFPIIGRLFVADINIDHITDILEPIWTKKTSTASRVRQRIENVLDWATTKKFRTGDNPARWKGHLENVLAQKKLVHKVKHQPALPFAEVPAFMAELRVNNAISARALEFTILTVSRTGEAIEASWSEFDLETGIWTVPAERMKARRAHRVPLSDRALEILKGLPREKGSFYVFPGGRKGKPLSNMAMLQLLRGMRSGVVVHGFRSSFRDWAGERTNFPREVIEAAMAHTVGDAAEAAYRRGDALLKRAKLMQAWNCFCAAPAKANNVSPMVRKVA